MNQSLTYLLFTAKYSFDSAGCSVLTFNRHVTVVLKYHHRPVFPVFEGSDCS